MKSQQASVYVMSRGGGVGSLRITNPTRQLSARQKKPGSLSAWCAGLANPAGHKET